MCFVEGFGTKTTLKSLATRDPCPCLVAQFGGQNVEQRGNAQDGVGGSGVGFTVLVHCKRTVGLLHGHEETINATTINGVVGLRGTHGQQTQNGGVRGCAVRQLLRSTSVAAGAFIEHVGQS